MQFSQANARPKIAKELALPTQIKIVLKNFPTLQEKIKIHRHTAQPTQQTMTLKLNISKTYNDTVDRRPAGNKQFGNMAGEVLLLGRSAKLSSSNSIQLLCKIAATSPSCQNVMGNLMRPDVLRTREPPIDYFDSS